MITASLVKELRELTGAGMLDCKKALEACEGNIEKSSEWLREKGISKAAKKADRIACEGLVNILIEGNKAVIIEVNSETDFVAKNDEFKDLIKTISNVLINSNVKTVEEALKLTTEDGTLEDTITNKIAKIGEKISFRRFEILEKTDSENFGSYIHMNGKIGVLTIVEVNSETDFVAKNDEFKDLINTILNLLIESNVSSVEEALALTTSDGTLSDTITNKIAKIGEKISFRRFELVTKSDNEVFGTYIHMGGKIGVLVVLEGSNEEVAKDVAMHAAAMRPKYLDIESVPTEDLDKEREIQKQVAINEGKPDNIAEKMVEGRIKKYYKEVCLTEQPFVKNDDMSVSEFVKSNGGKIISMVRYEVGEGMQKREENFAEEVAKQING